jgi:hypothetical protein
MLYTCLVLTLLSALLPSREIECFRHHVCGENQQLNGPRAGATNHVSSLRQRKYHSVNPNVYRSCLVFLTSVLQSLTILRSQVVITPASYSGGPGFKFLPEDRLPSLTHCSFSFFSFLQINAGIVPWIRSRPLPSISISIHYSLIILSLDGICLSRWQHH